MLLLKLLQSIIKTLNSKGTPAQVAWGLAIGSCLGLTPLVNAHNLVVFALALILDISLGGFFLGWTLAVPVGFLLDPLFDLIGKALLGAPSLQGLWTSLYTTPGVPLTNFNNSVVLGSVVAWLVLVVPMFFGFRALIARYRAHVYERLKKTKFFQAVAASKAANVYRWFTPDIG